ncbi:MAG: hypothetical protein KGL39_15885 [Patescibacteria group bacterium]|nr:hypothetical protein [Patescibacteria group bacterium]
MATFIPALAALGTGLLGDIFGGSSLPSSFDPTVKTLTDSGKGLTNTGGKALESGLSTLQSPISYYQKLLNGDQTATSEALGPEISQISSAYNSARGHAANFSPRGGGQVSSINNAGTAEAGQIGSLISKSRPEAAQELSSLGTAEAGIGENAAATGGSQISSALSSLLGEAGVNLNSSQQSMQNGLGIGFLLSLFHSGGGSSSTSSNSGG